MGGIIGMQFLSVPPGQHQLPGLPYAYNALEPVISAHVLNLHYNQHHKSYVEGLNKAELALVDARQRQDFSLVKHWERELAFHGSGHILHSLYWTSMAPSGMGQGTPGPHTLTHMVNYFGSFHSFKEQFTSAANQVEASGWALLVWQPAWCRLEILTIEKHQNLYQAGGIPILVIDSWEHAYYLDYQNRRSDYVNNWWHIVNWYGVERRLEHAMQLLFPMALIP